MKSERRKHVRFLSQEGAFAALGRKYTKVGKIKDISLGGLSFEYITGDDISNHHELVDIFLIGNEYHLYDVSCRVVYDVEVHVPHVSRKFVKSLTRKRCGLQFEKLADDKLSELKLFLESYSSGYA